MRHHHLRHQHLQPHLWKKRSGGAPYNNKTQIKKIFCLQFRKIHLFFFLPTLRESILERSKIFELLTGKSESRTSTQKALIAKASAEAHAANSDKVIELQSQVDKLQHLLEAMASMNAILKDENVGLKVSCGLTCGNGWKNGEKCNE